MRSVKDLTEEDAKVIVENVQNTLFLDSVEVDGEEVSFYSLGKAVGADEIQDITVLLSDLRLAPNRSLEEMDRPMACKICLNLCEAEEAVDGLCPRTERFGLMGGSQRCGGDLVSMGEEDVATPVKLSPREAEALIDFYDIRVALESLEKLEDVDQDLVSALKKLAPTK